MLKNPRRAGHGPSAGMVLMLVGLGACADRATGPAGPVLLGQWGTADAEVIAIRAGAEVRLPCATITVEAPVPLRTDQSFDVRGRLSGSGAQLGELPLVRVTGSISGTQLVVTAPVAPGTDPVTHVLEAGVHPQAASEPQCPL